MIVATKPGSPSNPLLRSAALSEPSVPSQARFSASDDADRSSSTGLAFANPLPAGMRDVLPPEAAQQSAVGRAIMAAFSSYGYQRVWLPLFEYASLLERGHTELGALRFVEPETGDVVALRSDMTPQIARVISTRYSSAPPPFRLCYQGSVLRRRRERARNASQVVQAGIELVGMPPPQGDLEVLEVLCSAVRATGLNDFVLDVGHAEIASSLIRLAEPNQREGLIEALSAKDEKILGRRAERAGLRLKDVGALVALVDLHGGNELWARASVALAGTVAEASLNELRTLFDSTQESGLAPQVIADLGDIWRFDYYTGPMFQILAHGPGEPLASGGRYDRLYDSFGAPSAAAGFALDIHNVCWALEHAGATRSTSAKVVAGPGVDPAILVELRRQGIACCKADGDLEAFARSWHFAFVMEENPLRVWRLPRQGAANQPLAGAPASVASQIADFIGRG